MKVKVLERLKKKITHIFNIKLWNLKKFEVTKNVWKDNDEKKIKEGGIINFNDKKKKKVRGKGGAIRVRKISK